MSNARTAAMNAVRGEDLMSCKVRALLHGYDARWRDEGWVTLGVEEEYRLPLVNPDTGKESRTFDHAGKFDGRATRDGRLYLVEHKSTSEDVSEPDSPYWKRLAIESQISGYMLASHQQGMKCDGVLYDVIKKPGIKPKKIPKEDRQIIIATRQYCGFDIVHRDDFHNMMEEDPQLYELRLRHDVMCDPDKYYQRRIIPRLDSEITDYACDLWDISKTMLESRNHDRNYRNPDACMTYGTPCRFLGVCSGYDTFDSGKWYQTKVVHSELPIIQGDERGGRDTITASRVKCFQSCRRKHKYQYEDGWRKHDTEDAEALQFGTLLHEGLAEWWAAFKGNNDEQHSIPSTATTQPELAW